MIIEYNLKLSLRSFICDQSFADGTHAFDIYPYFRRRRGKGKEDIPHGWDWLKEHADPSILWIPGEALALRLYKAHHYWMDAPTELLSTLCV
jgi:hypothetical protein